MDDTKATSYKNETSTQTTSSSRQCSLEECLELLEMLSPFRDMLIATRDQTLATQITTLLQAISDHDINELHTFIDILSNSTETVLNGYEAASKFSELWMEQEGPSLVEAGLLSGLL